MVKHKNSPKKGAKAGYAASIEQPVNDSTVTDSSISEPPPVVAKKSNLLQTKTKPVNKSRNMQVKKTTKQGAKVLKNIRKLQNSTDLLIPRAPFLRIVSKNNLVFNRKKLNQNITHLIVNVLAFEVRL